MLKKIFFPRGSRKGVDTHGGQAILAPYRAPYVNDANSHSTSGPYGLRTCYDPAPGQAEQDIVFIHGLTGNRENTWTHSTTRVFWPHALLASYMTKARIFTYGYDADINHFWAMKSQNQIGDHASTLLNTVCGHRERTGASERPIIFIAHSLGGLVVQDMLCMSRASPDEHLRKLWKCTYGVAFLGTPNCGSDLASWAKIGSQLWGVVKRSNTTLLSTLQPSSEVLSRIQDEFMASLRGSAGTSMIQITCFFEELPFPGIGFIVPKDSATIHGYNRIAIHDNHKDMARFASPDDGGFQAVLNEVWRWANNAAQKPSVGQQTTAPQGNLPPNTNYQQQLMAPSSQQGHPQSDMRLQQGSPTYHELALTPQREPSPSGYQGAVQQRPQQNWQQYGRQNEELQPQVWQMDASHNKQQNVHNYAPQGTAVFNNQTQSHVDTSIQGGNFQGNQTFVFR